MKFFFFVFLPVLHSIQCIATPSWSTDAHRKLIFEAFSDERADCKKEIQKGSEWADSFANQAPSRAYYHAMRTQAQSISQARTLMGNLIQLEYEKAVDLFQANTEIVYSTPNDPFAQFTHDARLILNLPLYLESCYHRGVALHPVMDSTSPAHADFAAWSLTDLTSLFKHGDLWGSVEDEQALIDNPNLFQKTIGLMRVVDKVYLQLRLKDFRFE